MDKRVTRLTEDELRTHAEVLYQDFSTGRSKNKRR